jgi:hypothetical protein
MNPVTLQAVWKADTDTEFITNDVEVPIASMVRDHFLSGLAQGQGDSDWAAPGTDQREEFRALMRFSFYGKRLKCWQ